MPEAFNDSIEAYRSGYFEEEYVFAKSDPGTVEPPEQGKSVTEGDGDRPPTPLQPSKPVEDPNKAGTRVDLRRIHAAGGNGGAAAED